METENENQVMWHQTMTAKIAILAALGLLLLIPLAMIQKVIRERSSYAGEAKKEIGKIWAESQTVTGPVLNIPVRVKTGESADAKPMVLHILPASLDIDGSIIPEIRYRGIYEAVVYDSEISLSGEFSMEGIDFNDGNIYEWDRAYLTLGVSDLKGLKDNVVIVLDGVTIEAEPGVTDEDVFAKGVSFPVMLNAGDEGKSRWKFNILLGLRGSEQLNFTPVVNKIIDKDQRKEALRNQREPLLLFHQATKHSVT